MVSVAMTTYNGEKYIRAQLESLRDQTLAPDEVVIFDDCSTDSTAELVRAFIADNGLTHWRFTVNSQNIGFVRNFYQTVDAASGDYIFLCDQDDEWKPDKIEGMVAVFKAHPYVQALCAGFEMIDGEGKKLPGSVGLVRGHAGKDGLVRIEFEEVLWRNIAPGCTSAYTRACRDFFARYRTGLCPHDWELNLFGAALGGLYYYDAPLTGYRIHGANTIGLARLKAAERLAAHARDPRIASAEEECRRAHAYHEADWLRGIPPHGRRAVEKLARLTELRYRALTRKKMTLWLALLCCLADYWRWRGPQGMLNDLRHIMQPGG